MRASTPPRIARVLVLAAASASALPSVGCYLRRRAVVEVSATVRTASADLLGVAGASPAAGASAAIRSFMVSPVRGGSFGTTTTRTLRTAWRVPVGPDQLREDTGFRCAM